MVASRQGTRGATDTAMTLMRGGPRASRAFGLSERRRAEVPLAVIGRVPVAQLQPMLEPQFRHL
jgi:hypothetical protein